MDVSLNVVTCGHAVAIPVTSSRPAVDSFVLVSAGRCGRQLENGVSEK